MSRHLLALVLPALVPVLVLGCRGNEPQILNYSYPILGVSQTSVEFGSSSWGSVAERSFYISNDGGTSLNDGMTMAVGSITLLDTAPDHYSLTYDLDDITCTNGSAPASTDSAAAKSLDIDTGVPEPEETGDTDPGTETGTPDDTGGTEPPEGALFLLDPTCRIPINISFNPDNAVGDVWGALEIETVSQDVGEEPTDEQFLAAYHKDPVRVSKIVYLHGQAEHAAGTLVVRPRTFDFGYVNAEDTDDHVTFIELENVGDGDLSITSVAFADTCDEAFSIVTMPGIGTLEPGGSTLAEVRFAPTDDQAAYCQLLVGSDDPAATEVEVTLTGNSGTDPENEPPTVSIRSPENGYKYNAIDPLELELNIFDVNQPATTLGCRVYSAVLQSATVASCVADSESGHFWVQVDPGDLDAGTDTLQVIVTDGSGITATAAVSVLISADYPEDDDDGDGYGLGTGEEGEQIDCDEGERETYPGAAELYDGMDNDCDGITDEGTTGYDDDGDTVSEADGDCNDYNEDAYPGAPERGDGVDNDCDTTVDEGTSLYDDDNDGYAEVNNDCDDLDAEVNPGATEACDGIDNDCDSFLDAADGCVDTSSDVSIVGGLDGVSADQYACESGQTVTLQAVSFDADGQVPTYAWLSDAGDPALFDNAASSLVHWTCPALAEDSGGRAYLVSVSVLDPDANSSAAFAKIAVYPSTYGLYDTYEVVIISEDTGCATSSTAPALQLAALALGLAAVRRRKG